MILSSLLGVYILSCFCCLRVLIDKIGFPLLWCGMHIIGLGVGLVIFTAEFRWFCHREVLGCNTKLNMFRCMYACYMHVSIFVICTCTWICICRVADIWPQ